MSSFTSFCPVCGAVLKRKIEARVEYFCTHCAWVKPYDPYDADIFTSKNRDSLDTLEKYKTLIEMAPFDPTNARIAKQCPQCSNHEMAYLIFAPEMRVVYKCECGYMNIIQ